jgi:hypothetical protein
VINATFSLSFPEPTYNGASYRGRGLSFASIPGFRWCCGGIGDIGSFNLPADFFAVRRLVVALVFDPFLLAMENESANHDPLAPCLRKS